MEITTAKEENMNEILNLYYKLYPERKIVTKFNKIDFKSEIFIAKNDDVVVGFLITSFISYIATKIGYIDELFIEEKFRKIGIGKSLVYKAIKWQKLNNAEVIFVTTDDAQEFYKKLGFRNLKNNSWLCKIP